MTLQLNNKKLKILALQLKGIDVNRIKKIWFILFILFLQNKISYTMEDSDLSIFPDISVPILRNELEIRSEQLILDSIVTLEMQFFIWKAIHPDYMFSINKESKKTAYQENFKTNPGIITEIKKNSSIKKEALHAALEAIRIAKFTAAIDVAYDNPTYLFFAPQLSSTFLIPSINQELIEKLNEYEKEIKAKLSEITGINPFNILWSWIPQGISNLFFTNQYHQTLSKNYNLQGYTSYSDTEMATIIKANDYKQKTNPKEAANLLWKQCLVAQNNYKHLYKKQNHISPIYIYDEIADFNEFCHITINNNRISNSTKHIELLQTRKAVQTALFIANKNSVFYLGYILPTIITQYLDGVIEQLMIYDQKLSNLCKDPRYGATADDIWVDTILTRISYAAAGIAITAAIVTDYQYGFGTSAKWLYDGLFNNKNTQNSQINSNQAISTNHQEQIKQAKQDLEQAKKAERKIYEEEIALKKAELDTILTQEKIEKQNLEKQKQEILTINNQLNKIIYQYPDNLKSKSTVRKDQDHIRTYIQNQKDLTTALKEAEKSLQMLEKQNFADSKLQAALIRDVNQKKLEIAQYKTTLDMLQEKNNIEKNIEITEKNLFEIKNKADTKKNELTKTEKEYNNKIDLFNNWKGLQIPQITNQNADTINLTEKEKIIENLEKNLIAPIEQIIKSDEPIKILTTFEQFKETITPKKEETSFLFEKAIQQAQKENNMITEQGASHPTYDPHAIEKTDLFKHHKDHTQLHNVGIKNENLSAIDSNLIYNPYEKNQMAYHLPPAA